MHHKDKKEKKKHQKKQKFWNNFTIFGDKKFAKKIANGKIKRSKGSFYSLLNDIFKKERKKNV